MVTILKEGGFRIVIYTNDHAPAHVHVIKAGGEAKINLSGTDGNAELVWADGCKKSDVRRAMQIVETHRESFLAEWSKIHG